MMLYQCARCLGAREKVVRATTGHYYCSPCFERVQQKQEKFREEIRAERARKSAEAPEHVP